MYVHEESTRGKWQNTNDAIEWLKNIRHKEK